MWWMTSTTGSAILGYRLKRSLSKALNGNIDSDSLAEIIIAFVWRFTRIGLFAILAAVIPYVLLYQQNNLIDQQGRSLDKQNLAFQALIENQNSTLESQLVMDSAQVQLISIQTELVKRQNEQIDMQNLLTNKQVDVYAEILKWLAKQDK